MLEGPRGIRYTQADLPFGIGCTPENRPEGAKPRGNWVQVWSNALVRTRTIPQQSQLLVV